MFKTSKKYFEKSKERRRETARNFFGEENLKNKENKSNSPTPLADLFTDILKNQDKKIFETREKQMEIIDFVNDLQKQIDELKKELDKKM